MKKLLISIILFFSLCFNVNAQEFETINDIQIHMRTQFVYALDRVFDEYFEYNQLPFVLEFTRMGDCDDFALYSYYYLQHLKIESKMYVLYLKVNDEIVGHAVTVFLTDNGTYSVFSNQHIFPTHETNALNAIKNLYPTWQFVGEWNPQKFGYLTYDEFMNAVKGLAFKDLKAVVYYLRWGSLGK